MPRLLSTAPLEKERGQDYHTMPHYTFSHLRASPATIPQETNRLRFPIIVYRFAQEACQDLTAKLSGVKDFYSPLFASDVLCG